MSEIERRSEEYRSALKKFDIFDASIWWAPEYVDTFAPEKNWEEEIEHLEERGITSGLVTVGNAANYDPYFGNDMLPELLCGHDRFYGCAVITPDMFYAPEEGYAYLKRMKDQRVVAARMFPGRYKHVKQGYIIDVMCECLEKLDMTLILWHIDMGWDGVETIVKEHPNLNVIVDSMDRKLLYHGRDYIPILQRYNNFHLETQNLVLFNELETIMKLAGAESLVYASYYPYMNLDFSLYPVYAANITEIEKQAIFGENARKLFRI